MVANGYDGILCELQEANNLASHDINCSLGHHCHPLVGHSAAVHMGTWGIM